MGAPNPKQTKRGAMHSELVRERIKTTALINRLTAHCLGRLKRPLDASQVTGILGLLRKSIPDLQAIEHSGDVEHTVHHTVSAEPLSEEAWQETYGGKGQALNG
jgi:hypothetical protein